MAWQQVIPTTEDRLEECRMLLATGEQPHVLVELPADFTDAAVELMVDLIAIHDDQDDVYHDKASHLIEIVLTEKLDVDGSALLERLAPYITEVC